MSRSERIVTKPPLNGFNDRPMRRGGIRLPCRGLPSRTTFLRSRESRDERFDQVAERVRLPRYAIDRGYIGEALDGLPPQFAHSRSELYRPPIKGSVAAATLELRR